MSNIEDYLKENSPFLPSVELSILNLIIQDLFLEQGYYIGEAIAKRLALMGIVSALEAFNRERGSIHTLLQGFPEYAKGFSRPLRLLQVSYAELVEGPGTARIVISKLSADEETKFLLSSLNSAVKSLDLENDSSSINLVNQVVMSKLQESSNEYFQIGLEAAKRTYVTYYEIVDTLVSNLAKDDREKPGALLPRLHEFEITASSLPKLISPKVQRLEKALAQFVANPSCGTALLIFLRNPGLLLHSIGLGARMIYNTRKDPNAALRELQKASTVMPKIKEAAARDWRPGEFVSRVEPDFAHIEEKISHIMPGLPPSGKDFVKEIVGIRSESQKARTTKDIERLLERWERLAKQPGLEQYSALWTAIHIAWGDLAERHAVQTTDVRFIKMARRAYTAPLKKSSIWRADLGTRCVCGARLWRTVRKKRHQFRNESS